ncbi:MAG TPA: alpha/beta fold hydrolase [Crinalium sp.]|jgi:carboxylesterase
MPSYSEVTTALCSKVKVLEDALPIRAEACRSQFFLHPAPTPKVCLFFHGFTAAPYQFIPIGRTLFNAGYNVIVPLMPGHGVAGKWSKINPPPLPTDPEIYQRFAMQWLKWASYMGDRVIVGGLSGGGALAAWLALEYAQSIDRALIFAPYLSNANKVIDLFTKMVDTYFEWTGPDGFGYKGFQVANLRVFLSIGQQVLKLASQKQSAPMFIVSSESDKAVDNRDHQALFEAALKRQPHCWYHRFDRVLDIPHTMMTEAEGNQYENLLTTMARAYIESNLTWDEVEEIGYRMTKGKTFNLAVADLKLESKVSPSMPAMMTMVDKWAIAVKRQLRDKQRLRDN